MSAQDVPDGRERELARLIAYHNERYWRDGRPEISDDEYDALIRELKSLDPDHPLLSSVEAPAVACEGKVVH